MICAGILRPPLGELRERTETQAMRDEQTAKEALTRLTRLAERNPLTDGLLKAALTNRLGSLAEVAVRVAVETGDPIGRVLAESLEECSEPTPAARVFDLCNKLDPEDAGHASVPSGASQLPTSSIPSRGSHGSCPTDCPLLAAANRPCKRFCAR